MTYRPFERRWFALSALLHLALLIIVPAASVDLFAPPANRSGGSTGARVTSPAFSSHAPIQVVELVELVELEARSVPELSPEAIESPSSPTRVDVRQALSRMAAAYGASPGGTTGELSPAAGGGQEGDYRPPVIVGLRWPDYPRDAPRSRESVTVELRVRVGPDGTVGEIEVVRPAPHELLNRAAIESARAATFEPATRGGRPVAAWVTLPITFHP